MAEEISPLENHGWWMERLRKDAKATRPEALRLANLIDHGNDSSWIEREAAAELRRLHEAHEWQYKMAGDRLRRIEKLETVNQELLEALKAMLVEKPIDELFEYAAWCKKQARAAIAKAEGEQK